MLDGRQYLSQELQAPVTKITDTFWQLFFLSKMAFDQNANLRSYLGCQEEKLALLTQSVMQLISFLHLLLKL